MSKSYELWAHGKQGDDFGRHLVSQHKSIPEALRAWAACFKDNAATCERLAEAFKDQNIEVNADTHLIQFIPGDDAAIKCLEAMVVEEMLGVVEFDDDEDDEEADDDDEDADEDAE